MIIYIPAKDEMWHCLANCPVSAEHIHTSPRPSLIISHCSQARAGPILAGFGNDPTPSPISSPPMVSTCLLSTEVPGRLKFFFCLGHCGEGCRGEGGVALGGRGGAGEEGVEDVVEEGLLLESGW